MPQEGIPGYLKYRVIEPNSGSVVIPDLPHLHESKWTVRALQRGYPGSATIGDFEISLPAPHSEEHKRSRYLYDQLAVGQKVEGYLGVITGRPRFSGVITRPVHKSLTSAWKITGSDTLWWLQQSQINPGEVIPGGLAPQFLIERFQTTQEVIWDDDFSNWNGGSSPPHNSADYTNSGWSFVSADPNLGLPALTATAVNPPGLQAVLTTNTSWAVGTEYSTGGVVTIQGTLLANTSTGAAGEAGIVLLGDATFQNGMLLRLLMFQNAGGSWDVRADIFTESAGTFTLEASSTVFTNVDQRFRFEVAAVIYRVGAVTHFRILINGKDSGLDYNTTTPIASGRIGLRFLVDAGGTPQVWVNRLQFRSRQNGIQPKRFAVGTVQAGSTVSTPPITGSGQSHLDLILLAAALDGWWVRKTPGYGFKADAIDYGSSPGTDLSSSIVFEEGVNIEAEGTEVTNVPDLYATDVRLQAVPGSDSGGIVTWRRVGALGELVLTDSVYDLGVPTFSLLVAYVRQIQALKAATTQAVQVAAVRTADTADKWRELDFVQIHIPTLGINHQKAQVMGYTFTEGASQQVIYLNQFPQDQLPQAAVQRTVRALEFLTALFARR